MVKVNSIELLPVAHTTILMMRERITGIVNKTYPQFGMVKVNWGERKERKEK
jgi:hypothetical protein